MMWRNIRNLSLFALACLLLSAALFVFVGLPYQRANGLVHPARNLPTRTPAELGLEHYETIHLTSADGLRLTAWYLPPQNGAVVICVHGLGGNRAQLLDEAAFLHEQGYGALLLDLRNHGESQGQITTYGFYETQDIAAALGYIQQREGDGVAVAVFGHSLGAAVSLLAAAQLPEIKAVIAASPFTSLEDNLNEALRTLTGLEPRFFAPLVLFFAQREAGIDISAVRPVDVIASLSPRAVLIIHGAQDTTLPVRNSYQLYEAAREPKELVVYPTVGHGGFLEQEPTRYPQKILDFLAQRLSP